MRREELASLVLANVKTSVGASNVTNREMLTKATLGLEDMDSGKKEMAQSQLSSLRANIDSAIQTVGLELAASNGATASMESFFTKAQLKAAEMIAALAASPSHAREGLKNLKPGTNDANAYSVNPDGLGIEDMVDANAIASLEAYDGESLQSAIYYSVTYNLLAARQDDFGEAFFPTITIDPTVGSAVVTAEFISLHNEIVRKRDGSTDEGKFGRRPIVKAIYDNTVFNDDRNRAYPVMDSNNSGLFLNTLSHVVTVGGEAITTAPLKFGQTVGLLGLSQTDALLAKGIMDNTDALDRRMVMQNIYFDLTGKDAQGNAVTETFVIPTGMLPGANFVPSPQDHMRSMLLSFNSKTIAINTSTVKTASGAASVILGGIPNTTIVFNVVINGTSNTQTSDTSMYASSFTINSVLDASGNVMAAGSTTYTAVTAAVTTMALTGFDLEAYRTNSNLRTNGQLISSDRYTWAYTVPLRSGVTVLSPVANQGGNDNDATKISQQATFAGLYASSHAVNTLIDFIDFMRNSDTNGGVANTDLAGVGKYYVNPYFSEDNIDIQKSVDSINSFDRQRDISAVLTNYIKNEVLNMVVTSNYLAASNVENAGGVIDVIVGTDPVLARYLLNGQETINIGDKYRVHVVETLNILMKGKMAVTFGVYGASRNEKPNPLNFGQMFWAPTVSADVVRTIGGATSRVISTFPRYLHTINLPIISVFNVTDIAGALGKVFINTQNLAVTQF